MWKSLLTLLLLALCVSVVVCDAEEDAQAETFEITEEMLRELQEQGIDISKINFATPGSGEEGGKKVMPPPRRPVPEIRTAISFQNNPQGKDFVAGEKASAVVGLRNMGHSPLDLTWIVASLRHPYNFKYPIQNFSAINLAGVVVAPTEEASIAYSFTPDLMLEARSFGLFVELYYHDERHNYSSPIYNVTVNILEPVTVFDSKSLFIYVLGISIAAIVAFGGSKLFKKLKTGSHVSSSSSKASKSAKGGEKEVNEWLVGTTADPTRRHKKH